MDKTSDFLFTGAAVVPLVLGVSGYLAQGGLLFVILLIAAVGVSASSPDAPYKQKDDDS